MARSRLALGAFLLGLTAPAAAVADPRSMTGAYSDYESTAIHDAERSLRAEVDRAPEGKAIERIDLVRLDPIDANDPLPVAFDALHSTSRPYVIRRNLLVKEGDIYRKVLVDESARNLRKLRQLSLVVCVAMRGSTEDRVRLVVVTKDVWSLYVDFDVAVTSGGLESLTLEPKETNIAGSHQSALGRVVLEPQTVTLGAGYEVPRVDGRWLSLSVDANAVVNRESGLLEGGYGATKVQRPLFSSRAEWAWSFATTFANRIRRRYVNAEVAAFTPDPAAIPDAGSLPWAWRERSVSQRAEITRSYGWAAKSDLSIGASLARSRYSIPSAAAFDPRSVAAFTQAAVPIGEDRVGPYVQWHAYTSDFLRTFDLDTLGLQEDYRLGYDATVRAYPIGRALGSTRDLLGVYAGASYAIALGDGIVRAAVESTVESEPSRVTDASLRGALGVVTPRFGPRAFLGRLFFGANVLSRVENYLNAQSFLGGESLLRGYPSRALVGEDLVAASLEYRTRSLNLVAIELAGVAFVDAGDAFSGFDAIRPKRSAGGGLRIVFPQIDRTVLRVDLGVPLGDRSSEVPPVALFVGFHQALALPSATAL